LEDIKIRFKVSNTTAFLHWTSNDEKIDKLVNSESVKIAAVFLPIYSVHTDGPGDHRQMLYHKVTLTNSQHQQFNNATGAQQIHPSGVSMDMN
jgi:hypothetical protein